MKRERITKTLAFPTALELDGIPKDGHIGGNWKHALSSVGQGSEQSTESVPASLFNPKNVMVALGINSLSSEPLL